MAFFTNMADSGLRVYPTHRVLVSLPEGLDWNTVQNRMADYFEPVPDEKALFWLDQKQAYSLKPGVDLSAIPESLRGLDVAILDHVVFQGILKQPANDLKTNGHLLFIRDEAEVMERLNAGAHVFWVHAPGVDVIQEVCSSGFRMPQKSTYFYPKLLSGLVLYYYGT
jgi:uncharacterized protein (DUF1015 family)